MEDAEEEMQVEVEHSTKFLTRGDGLRHDFSTADSARRRRLLRGVWENERALLEAMREAEATGLPREYMEKAIRVQLALSVARTELEADYERLEGTRREPLD